MDTHEQLTGTQQVLLGLMGNQWTPQHPTGDPMISGNPTGAVRPDGHPEVIRHPVDSQWAANGYTMVNGCPMGIQWSMGIQWVFSGYSNTQWAPSGHIVGTQQPPHGHQRGILAPKGHPCYSGTLWTPNKHLYTKWAPWHAMIAQRDCWYQ